MERRIGTVIIKINSRLAVSSVNEIISRHSNIVIGRLGLPLNVTLSLITLVLDGTTDDIGSLTGQLGRIEGIEVKSALLKSR